MTSVCPCCGGPSEKQIPFWVDVEKSAICVDGKETHLPKGQAILAKALADKYPSAARLTYLIDCLYNDDIDGGPENPRNVVAVQICHLRKIIKPLGINVEAIWGVGWFLEIDGGQDGTS